ncbi:hypothetical protein J3R30DRAFT_566608 [Lentinula aciculospora]|uniref:Uncharacterized protein n=1 Tax=Lentinula aciculospora TaxID=153920 RepID=A0A9W9DL43_9AGAR|nr:hypothetical protein J3R30DRAFT_566608 [Lentinula aciculospora]
MYLSLSFIGSRKSDILELWSRVLCNAPTDIARSILEFAAQLDKTTACSIALVSKEANAWVTPILYQTVILTDAHIEMVEAKLPSFEHTKTLILSTSSVPEPSLLKVSYPALRQLHIHDGIAWEISQKYLISALPDQLHELVVNSPLQSAFAFMPIYSALTHLAFVHDIPRSFPEIPPQAFPHLTHFACPYFVTNGRSFLPVYETSAMLVVELAYTLDKVLQIPSLRVAVVLVKDFSEVTTSSETAMTDNERQARMYALLREVPQKDAEKVVLIARRGTTFYDDKSKPEEAWDTSATSSTSYWHKAEVVRESRRVTGQVV